MPSEKILFFFVPDTVATDELYNPTGFKSYRIPPGNPIRELLKVPPGVSQVVLTNNLGQGQYEIIRRTNWPASQNDFDSLVSSGNSDGTGTSEVFILKGEDEQFNLGTPLGLHPGKTFVYILLLIAAVVAIKEL